MPFMDNAAPVRHMPIEKLRVARLVGEGYRHSEIAQRTDYAHSTVKSIVGELADLLTTVDTNTPPSIAVRDWWRDNRLQVAMELLDAIGVSVDELLSTHY